MTQAAELDVRNHIPPDLVIFPNGVKWLALPESTRQRILALARAKLNLNYDPTMVDPKWRG